MGRFGTQAHRRRQPAESIRLANLRLRFPLEEISHWAEGYSYADDAEVERIGKEAGTRGGYTRDELLRVARWKTRGRSEWRCKLNTAEDVRRATARALATDDERERVAVLIGLHGVQLPTASALLHLARPSLFPIIDFRALWSLGIDEAPTFYGFPLWWAYVTTCRSLAANAGVSMRRLDRALWQYSKQHQERRVPVGDRAPIHMRTTARANVPPRASERIESTRSEIAMGPVGRAFVGP